MTLRELYGLGKEAGRQWIADDPFQLGAALAYYTVFSLAPILVIAIAIAGAIFGEEAARARIVDEISRTVGPTAAEAVGKTLTSANQSPSGPLVTAVSIALLVFGATGVFAQLQQALNTVWGLKARPDRGWLHKIKDRFWSFAVVVCLGFLLLVSLVVSAALSALSSYLTPDALPGGTYLWQGINQVVSFAFVAVLFAMIYRLLPDVEVAWRDVAVGAVVAALLFTGGKYLIGLYLAKGSVASAYGAAGSLVVILVWVYYSSQILLFGAEVTEVWAVRYGRPFVQIDKAEPLTDKGRDLPVGPAQSPEPVTAGH